MAFDSLKNVEIMGIACAVPSNIIKSEEFYRQFGKEVVEKFVESVGIKQRHLVSDSNNQTAADLCFQSAELLIKNLAIERNSIDALIFVSQYLDYSAGPATACVLQHRLCLSNECLAYDVNQGCAGYLYGLYLGGLHLQTGRLKRVLVLVGDARHQVSQEDKSMAMLFGDAGSATLLNLNSEAPVIHFLFKTMGSGFRNIILPCGGARHRSGNTKRVLKNGVIRSDFDGYMEGSEVFNFTIKEVPKLFKEFYEKYKFDNCHFDIFALHQANKFMIDYLGKKLKIEKEKLLVSIGKFGNTSSASIPLTLCDYFNGGIGVEPKEINVVISGFGVGFSLGIANISISKERCFPIIETSEGWEDGVL